MRLRVVLLVSLLMAGCAGMPAQPPQPPQPSLRLIGMQQLAPDLRVDATLVGGISGIDYDARSGEWLLASDDRGEHGPARFYRARIAFDAASVGAVTVLRAVGLEAPSAQADLEALRIDPRDGAIWITSEGDRKARGPAFVRRVDARGRHQGELAYPPALQIHPGCACGGRDNMGMEGMSFTPDGSLLWLALEAPPLQDGPAPGPGQGALTRITLAERSGKVVAQYAYPLDPAPAPAFAGGFVDNGISEILAIGPRRLLVVERAGRQIEGTRFGFDVRLYAVDLEDATPLDPERPLAGARVTAGVKRLLFDTARLPPDWADNYEAMAWGPALPGGRRSLLIASDNNFNGGPTRFLVFDAGPADE